MLVQIVGLGPGDPGYLTMGGLQALRAGGRCIALLAPPDLIKALQEHGIDVIRDAVPDAALLVRGSADAVDHLVEHLAALPGDSLGIAVLGSPLSDFAGLPLLLRALEARGHRTEIVPGMPHATLSA